jgi:hypothetical protein
MKQFSMKFLSVVLVIAILLSVSSAGVAASNNDSQVTTVVLGDISVQLSTYDEAQVAQDAYYGLSPEARAIFDQMLALDSDTRAFHIANVDSSFNVANVAATGIQSITTLSNTSVATVVSQLNALNLPSAVVYSLEAVASGIIAALADGPLPFGDILLLVATVGAAVVIAANWSSISSKWSSIVSIFTNAFSSIYSAITDVFSEISAQVPNINSAPSISINFPGKTVTINGTTYSCSVEAQNLTQQQKTGKKYYVALLVHAFQNVFVCPIQITDAVAKSIIYANNSYVGVFASADSYALGLVSPNYRLDFAYNGDGYYNHYHKLPHLNCHVWYPF